MAFWDDLNAQAQRQALQGGNQSWADFQKRKEQQDQMAKIQSIANIKGSSKSNFLTSLIPTAGGVGGTLGGAALGASVGSIVPGIGTAIGGLIGAVLGGAGGSAIGKVGENAVEGESDLGKGVLGEAALGGLTSIPVGAGLKLLKAGGTLAKGLGSEAARTTAKSVLNEAGVKTIGKGTLNRLATSGSLDDATRAAMERVQSATGKTASRLGKNMGVGSNKILASQSGMTASQARALNLKPPQTFGNIQRRTGLTRLDDMAEVGRNLTGNGDNSLLDTLTNAAIGEAKGIDVGDLRKAAQNIMDDGASLLTDTQRKQVLNNMKNAGISIYGGSKGSLSSLGDASVALKQANNFRDTARKLSSGFNPSAQEKQMADIYNGVASQIENKLYTAQGVNASIPMLVKSGGDDLLFKAQAAREAGNTAQAKAYESLAKELRGAKTVKDIRTMKKDFVDLGKIDKATQQAEGARTLTGDQYASGLSSLAKHPIQGLVGAVANGVALPATKVLSGVSDRLGAGSSKSVGQDLIKTTARIGAANAMANGLGQPLPDQNIPVTPANMAGISSTGTSDGPVQSTEPSIGGFTKSQIEQAMVAASADGNSDAFNQLKALYSMLPKETTPSTGFSRPSAQVYSQANTGLQSVQQLAGLLQSDPNVVNKSALPGQGIPVLGSLESGALGTSQYNAISNNILNSIARINTGANMPANERRFYEQTYLPQPGDSQDTINSKMQALVGFFEPIANYQSSSTGGSTDLVSALQAAGL